MCRLWLRPPDALSSVSRRPLFALRRRARAAVEVTRRALPAVALLALLAGCEARVKFESGAAESTKARLRAYGAAVSWEAVYGDDSKAATTLWCVAYSGDPESAWAMPRGAVGKRADDVCREQAKDMLR